jgi:predicted anti-sigma-YlaC factor YlaD
MRVYKSQCSLFKNFYGDFLRGKVDKETKEWMAIHKEECSYCREWAISVEENREDKVVESIPKINKNYKVKDIVKKVMSITSLAMITIVIITFCMSISSRS